MSTLGDKARAHFLRVLDDAAEDGVEVTDWEARFLGDNLGREDFTQAQRDAIDRMIERYSARLGLSAGHEARMNKIREHEAEGADL